jgi:hypothetical protein
MCLPKRRGTTDAGGSPRSRKLEPPEAATSCLGDDALLGMHLELPEVEDIERPIRGIDADINRSRERTSDDWM